VNDYGFIETPYREVVNGRVTNNIRYLFAWMKRKRSTARNLPLPRPMRPSIERDDLPLP